VTWAITTLRIEVEDDGTGFARLDEFISRLKNKNNTLRMRAMAIGADLQYKKGDSGLLALITYRL
jgi:signal transduction histidine kinase